ncbi:MAG: hypothetical protein ABH819_03810 [Patescibacteria group bacterium]
MRIRKNDKAYLQDLKIDIQIDNNLAFQEIALLVDKPDFLQMLPFLRKDLGIVNLVSLDEFMDTAYDKPLHSKGKKKINLSKYKDAGKFKEFAKYNEIMATSGDLEDEMDLFQLIATEVNLTCLQFKRPPYFADVVRQAIYCGAVNEDYFKPTSAQIVEKDILFSTSGHFQLPQIAIFISPTTTYEELKTVFREANSLFKTDKRLIYYQPRVDITPNIRKYRKWYWERIKGKTYKQIADECPDNEVVTDLDILKAVKTYSNLLAR